MLNVGKLPLGDNCLNTFPVDKVYYVWLKHVACLVEISAFEHLATEVIEKKHLIRIWKEMGIIFFTLYQFEIVLKKYILWKICTIGKSQSYKNK